MLYVSRSFIYEIYFALPILNNNTTLEANYLHRVKPFHNGTLIVIINISQEIAFLLIFFLFLSSSYYLKKKKLHLIKCLLNIKTSIAPHQRPLSNLWTVVKHGTFSCFLTMTKGSYKNPAVRIPLTQARKSFSFKL